MAAHIIAYNYVDIIAYSITRTLFHVMSTIVTTQVDVNTLIDALINIIIQESNQNGRIIDKIKPILPFTRFLFDNE